MKETRKKSSQLVSFSNLSHTDYQKICNISTKIAAILKVCTDNFDVDRYAKQLNESNKKDFAGMFLLFRAYYAPNKYFNPGDLNKDMLNKISGPILSDDSLLNSTGIQSKHYISENRLSEILTIFKKTRLFRHVDTKKDIKKIVGVKKGKLKGRPSLYLISQKSVTIKKLLSNPESVDMIVTSLIDSKLLIPFIRCLIKGFLQFLKITNENQLYEAFCSVVNEPSEDIANNIQRYMEKPLLSSLKKSQMNKIVKEKANEVMKLLLNDKRDFLICILVLLSQLKIPKKK